MLFLKPSLDGVIAFCNVFLLQSGDKLCVFGCFPWLDSKYILTNLRYVLTMSFLETLVPWL